MSNGIFLSIAIYNTHKEEAFTGEVKHVTHKNIISKFFSVLNENFRFEV